MNLNVLLQPFTNMFHKALSITLNYASDVGDRAAAQPLGQFLFQKTEDIIWAVEKSIEWSLPTEDKRVGEPSEAEAEQNGSQGKVEPLRPLPWIVFIPVLIMWRCARFGYETAMSLVGKTPIKPAGVVNFLRNQRRNLRAVRIRGKRTMTSAETSPTAISKLRSIVQLALNRAVCFAGPDAHKEEMKTCMEVKAHTESDKKEQKKQQQQDEVVKEEDEEDKENVLEKLNRLSCEEDNIENDSDFEPAETSMSSSQSDNTEEESEDTSIRQSAFVSGDTIQEVDEALELEDNQEPYLSLSSQSQMAQTSEDDSSSLSTRNSELIDSHESAMQKLSHIFKKKTIITQTSI